MVISSNFFKTKKWESNEHHQNSPVPKTPCLCLDDSQIPQGWVFPRISHFMPIDFNGQCPI